MDYQYKIRAHHGMCLAFYQGNGYSSGFTKHMTEVKETLERDDPVICLADHADEICSACPNLQNNVCKDAEKVVRYDHKVLQFCNLTPGQVLKYSEFASVVRQKILNPGRREEICGDCEWSSICHF